MSKKHIEHEEDKRVTTKRPTWVMYIGTFFTLSVLAAGQALIFNAFIESEQMPIGFVLGMIGYWAIVAIIFCLLTNWQRIQLFERPMRKMSKAAKQVAQGDFSVWLEPIHKGQKKDYIDVMFDDFNTMVESLGSIETLKSDFISNVSHEIKTPLAVIQSYSMALQNDALTPELRDEYTQTIVLASQKMSTLVTNILKLSKLENLELMPVAEPYDLCSQLYDSALLFENLWEAKHISFEAELEERAIIQADESMLEIVWNNLLSNALKFTEVNGTVKLCLAVEETSVVVSISDSGCGMNTETLNHIFDKFYQGDTSHSQEGNGLGLALSAKVVELVGGTIQVNSEVGKGSTFVVTLPRKATL